MSTLIKKNGAWKTVARLSSSDVIRNPDWSRAVAVPNNGTAGWTAPEDGLIVGSWGGNQAETTSGNIDYLKVNDVIIAGSYRYPNNNGIQIPVNKGDVLSETGGTAAYWNVHFVPYKVSIAEGLITDEIEVAPVTLGSNFTGTVSVKKRLGTVTVTLLDLRPVSKTGSTAIFTLPDGFKPASTDFGILWSTGNEERIINIPANTGIVEVGGDGVTSWFDEGTPKHLWGTVTFIAAM